MNGALANFHAEIKIRANINVLSMLYKAIVGKNAAHAEQLALSWQEWCVVWVFFLNSRNYHIYRLTPFAKIQGFF